MSPKHEPELRSRHNSSRKALLDAERLEAIRKRIAEGFYNRNDVRHSIAARLARSIALELDQEGCDDAGDAGDDAGCVFNVEDIFTATGGSGADPKPKPDGAADPHDTSDTDGSPDPESSPNTDDAA